MLVGLVTSAASWEEERPHLKRASRLLAPADTDSVALQSDSLRADSLVLVRRYLPSWKDQRSATLFPRQRPFMPGLGPFWNREIELDSTGRYYVARERVGETDVRDPLRLDYDAYRRARLTQDLNQNFRELSEQRALQRQQEGRRGLGVNIVVPGGRQSAFSTIFGKPEVDLRVNGQADIRAGFDYRKSDQQVALTGSASQIDPDFKQDLRLGITGTIGDKLRVDVNWDTNNDFDYQNQLKLQYTGYEDEIIQSIEAGNVFLETPSTLIRGGQSLFGIKSELQFGGVTLTTVASQQEGQANTIDIEGGSETSRFAVRPTEYDSDTHFFLAYYFRNRWEEALSQPPNILLADGFERITEIEVWKLQRTDVNDQDVRNVAAVVDLGERPEILNQSAGNLYTAEILPDPAEHQYDPDDITAQLRRGTSQPQSYLESLGLTSSDYQIGQYKRLEQGRDYDVDETLGYITLRQRLQQSEALAVAFSYTAGGRTYQVGDFTRNTGGTTGGQNSDRLALKLLRSTSPQAPSADFFPAAWYLELRNIYRLQGRGLDPQQFELNVYYEPPGSTAETRLPGIGGQQTLLQLLGLDRLNENGAANPDNRFDYLIDFTIDPDNGYLIFPYLEPFGQRISEIAGDDAQAEERYAFSELYSVKPQTAESEYPEYNVYQIEGEYKGGVQDFYDLGSYTGVIEGSVRVTSGGTELQEGIDYTVDYQGGTVLITNPSYLSAGRDIQIDYEQNSLFQFQKKTLLGVRADYELVDRLAVGATLMRLTEKSQIDKFRIGEEPVSNTIWGVDGTINLEPRWLTRAIDVLPLIQTRAPSSIRITGEFAQLLPSSAQTNAFDIARDRLRDQGGRDFTADQLSGISYIDDFEGFENTFSLKSPGAWQLAAPPDSIGAIDSPLSPSFSADFSRQDSLRTTWRAGFTWYQANRNILEQIGGAPVFDPEAVNTVDILDVFPNRDVSGEQDRTLSTMDLYFDPQFRGPYNYTTELTDFLARPEATWGGMTQRLPEGYTDFNLKNIDFIEFIVRLFPENQQGDAGPEAKLYVDLGSISEDVVPNGRLNNEDGLQLTSVPPADIDPWGRTPSGIQNATINTEGQRTEDVGLDGLASYRENDFSAVATEAGRFNTFLNSLRGGSGPVYDAEVARSQEDPSADDYHFFGDDAYFGRFPNGGATVQQRFLRYFPGLELNAYEAQNQFGNSGRGNSRFPDTEDLNLNSTLDQDNSYYQYEIPISLDSLQAQARPDREDDYIVGEIKNGDVGTGWYQVRIPIREFTRKAGNIDGFDRVESIRVWTSGHRVPITMRLATFDLVGSQWRKADDVALTKEIELGYATPDANLTISSINNEENDGQYDFPLDAIISQTRLPTGGVQNAREQALVLRVENLEPEQQRAIFKAYNQELDLLKYSNLRMAAHLDGRMADGMALNRLPEGEARDKVKLFVRIGANETTDYYEYEQPLSPSPEGAGDNSEQLWLPDLNAMNLELEALNELKVTRDEIQRTDLTLATDSLLWSDDPRYRDQLGELDLEVKRFAPPGTRIGIKGTPSLGRVNTIVIGVRSAVPYNGTTPTLDETISEANVWVNELRVSGYDQTNGRSALANADVVLADLGRVKASFQTQTDGFGSLESTLGERDQDAIQNWGVTADMNLDKLVAERYGWNAPVSVQVQSNTSTPRFAPSRGDVRLETLLDQIDRQNNLSEAEKEIRKDQAIEEAQDYSFRRSFTASLSKTGSDSRLLRSTLDPLSINYSFSDDNAHSPAVRLRDGWNWSTTVGYNLRINRPRTLRPLWFFGGIPVVGFIGDLRFNYAPQSITLGANVARNFSQSQDRARRLEGAEEASLFPDLIDNPLRQQHSFSHRRNFALQYNPFEFLGLSFDANTNQSLNALGADTLYALVARGPQGNDITFPLAGPSLVEAKAVAAQNGFAFDSTAFLIDRLNVLPSGQVLSRISSGIYPRSEQYAQRFTGTFRPTFSQGGLLDWVSFQDVTYNALYSWQNGPVGQATGASVSNRVEYITGIQIQPQTFWQKFGFYRRLEERQREAEQEAQAAQQRREQARQERREQRRREKEQEDGEEDLQDEGFQDDMPLEEMPPEEEAEGTVDETGSGGSRFLPSPASLLRRFVLAITGVRDFSINYSGDRSARSSGVGYPGGRTPYTFYDRLSGNGGPSLDYRFGLTREIEPNQRVFGDLQVTDILTDGNQVKARTSINPSSSLQISLNWSTDWSETTNLTYPNPGAVPTETQSGENNSSVWAFGASFQSLFDRQYATYLANGGPGAETLTDNGNGRVVLTNESIVEDFRDSFVSGPGPVDRRGYLPFPMPGWLVNYTGLSNFPLLRRITQSITVRHGYNADYATSYRSVGALDDTGQTTIPFNNQTIIYNVPAFQAEGVRINERFQPLIGFDVTWRGQVQTGIQWNKSNAYALSTSSEVNQQKTSEISLTMSWQKQGLRLPFFDRRLNNRISFNLTASRSSSDDRRFLLQNALLEKASAGGGEPTATLLEALGGEPINASTRLRVTPQISYQFSNRVSANFTLNYEKFDNEVGRVPSSTTINGGFNVRVAISN